MSYTRRYSDTTDEMRAVTLLDNLLDTGVVDAADIALVTGSTVRSVARWAHGTPPRRQAEDRLLELKAVVDLLGQVLDDEPAANWLRTPNPDLGYDKPIDLLTEGQYRRVIGSLLAIAEGVTA